MAALSITFATTSERRTVAARTQKPRRVIFVDADPGRLQGLEQMLLEVAIGWDAHFVTSGAEARALLEQHADVDAIVTDLHLRDAPGPRLLDMVRERFPGVARLALSDEAGDDATLLALSGAHQFVSRSIRASSLTAAVNRVVAVRSLCESEASREALGRVTAVPPAPAVYARITEQLADPNVDVGAIAKTVARDPMLAAKFLQLVNSSCFARGTRISDLRVAVVRLGLRNVRSLVLCSEVFSSSLLRSIPVVEQNALQHRSVRISQLAGKIADEKESATTAALLCDVGLLLLAAAIPGAWPKLRARKASGVDAMEAEREIFGVDHAAAGAYVLAQWGLPDPIVEAVGWHHAPSAGGASTLGVTGAVHAASAIVCDTPLDEVFLQRTRSLDRVKRWRYLAANDDVDD
jgi:HD-like signal output (HDOD) protein